MGVLACLLCFLFLEKAFDPALEFFQLPEHCIDAVKCLPLAWDDARVSPEGGDARARTSA
ncbi:MAG: hypothetical protein ACP5II_07255 [Infirmifilum sp.]|uniref:hypothetical protein n=1 Tax=Infirmifilum TaxID=2856573 RepID=UPI00168D31C7|nr:hypothetical protein [Infirmifilum uzonense]